MAEKLPQTFGSYTLHELIARGGMAEIYRATMPGIGGFEKTVAIKKILPHLAENDEFITMLIDEARIIVSINHSNIAQVYDLGRIEDTYYIAMEYIHGTDLATVIKELDKRGQRLPVEHVAYIASCICAGLHVAHSKTDERGRPLNIVHRDVSPHNVLLSFAGDVKIIDFGVAKASNKETHTKMGVIKGKLLYMAPEQAMAKDVDGRADLFAVGLCMYKMLTHRLPFEGENEFQIYNNILSKEIVPPKEFNAEVSEELNQVVMTLLQRDPNKRYQDGYAAKEDLERALHNLAPGYTVNRLSRYVEDNFAELARRRRRGSKGDADSDPSGLAPATPASTEVGTGQLTAEALPSLSAEPVGTADAQRVPAAQNGQQRGAPATPAGPPPRPPSDQFGAPMRTKTNEETTGQFEPAAAKPDAAKGGVPPALYAIGAILVVIAGLSAYALLVSPSEPAATPGDTAAAVAAPETAEQAAADRVILSLTSTPPGATLSVDDEVVGQTPVEFRVAQSQSPLAIRIEKEGFEPVTARLTPETDLTESFELTAIESDEVLDFGEAEIGEAGEGAPAAEAAPGGEPDEQTTPKPEAVERQPTTPTKPDRPSSGSTKREPVAEEPKPKKKPEPSGGADLELFGDSDDAPAKKPKTKPADETRPADKADDADPGASDDNLMDPF